MAFTVALCDDEAEQIANLRRLIGEWSSGAPFAVDIVGYESAEEFLFAYPDRPCDLLLLDIEMRGLGGMALAKKLRAAGDLLPIAFITGYSDYMAEGYDVRALHYLLKPVERERLFSVLERAAARRESAEELIVSSDRTSLHIAADEIVYVEAFGRRTELHLADGRVLPCDMPLGRFEGVGGLIRCHRSYLVGLRYIRAISRTAVLPDGGGELPLSRRLYKDVNDRFIDFYTRDEP
ncbi:MAG: LytTR family DNA-binding domain-containing protein [Bacteroides sp.]|nr:LytTR family DNA-binding domain-containing protein [Eubacterium sp.]MCM1418630.1 LytTR family DNA-binding domain-containing protein [Roseburia sp.]MCM1462684.1 LytTR family DNA-binding domain-containing protein [Bacteroides sp.]